MQEGGSYNLRARYFSRGFKRAAPGGVGDSSPAAEALCAVGLRPGVLTKDERTSFGGRAAEYLEARDSLVKRWYDNVGTLFTERAATDGVDPLKLGVFNDAHKFLQERGYINFGVYPDSTQGTANGGPSVSNEPIDQRQLVTELHSLLKSADMQVASEKSVRKDLEHSLGRDLTCYKKLIRRHVQYFLDHVEHNVKGQGPVEPPDLGFDEVPAPTPCPPASKSSGKRVAVVGAGAAGLAAAGLLKRNGIDTVVLEARDRIGGRVFTDKSTFAAPIDLGASLITGIQADVERGLQPDPSSFVCKQLGIQLHDLHTNLPLYDGKTGLRVSQGMDLEVDSLRDELLDEARARVDMLGEEEVANESLGQVLHLAASQRLSADRLASCPDANLIDDANEDRFTVDQKMRILNWHWANLEYGCSAPLDKVSLAHWNQDEEYGGFGGSHCMVKGGFSQIIDGLASELDIRLNTAVTDISYETEDCIQITTTEGEVFSCDAVIVTVPLGVLKAGKLKFSPALPAWKQNSISQLGFGSLNKVVLQFEEVFWDDVDFFGVALEPSSRERGSGFMFWNFNRCSDQPILTALWAGEAAESLEEMSKEDIQAAVLKVLRQIYGDRVGVPVSCAVTNWTNDEHSGGSYSYVAVGASAKDYDYLALPVGRRVLFAGEHTCKEHPDTVGGAILTGIREGTRALRILSGGSEQDQLLQAALVLGMSNGAGQQQSNDSFSDSEDAAPTTKEGLSKRPREAKASVDAEGALMKPKKKHKKAEGMTRGVEGSDEEDDKDGTRQRQNSII